MQLLSYFLNTRITPMKDERGPECSTPSVKMIIVKSVLK